MQRLPFCLFGLSALSFPAFAQGTPLIEGFSPQFVISTGADRAEDVHAADLDGDGDIDVLSTSEGDDKIAWYENLGGGAFGPEQIISQTPSGDQRVLAADLDGDGDLDVIWSGIQNDQIVWHENLGGAVFGAGQALNISSSTPYSIATADLDGDGDLDVVAAFLAFGGPIAFFENLGGGAFGPETVIDSDPGVPNFVRAADLDGDGDPDLLASTQQGEPFLIYQNLGGLNFGPSIALPSPAGFQVSRTIEAFDLDGDGDRDVLTTLVTPNSVNWHENLGNGNFGPRQVISIEVAGTSTAVAADFDRDGDLDVVAGGSGAFEKIAWFENLGGGSFGPLQGIVPDNEVEVLSVSAVFTADIDGDGDADVLSSSVFDDKIAWYANQTASAVSFGQGCGTPALAFSPTGLGNLNGTIGGTIENAPAVTFVNLGVSDSGSSLGGLPLALDAFGFPGCTLYASLELFGLATTPSGTPGSADWSLPIPSNPALVGVHLYTQAVGLAVGTGPLEVTTSNGIDWQIAD